MQRLVGLLFVIYMSGHSLKGPVVVAVVVIIRKVPGTPCVSETRNNCKHLGKPSIVSQEQFYNNTHCNNQLLLRI